MATEYKLQWEREEYKVRIVTKSIGNAPVKLSSKEIYGEAVGRGQEVDLHVERIGI